MEIDIEEVKEVKLIMWQKEQGFPPRRCVVEINSPVSTEYVTLCINGRRYEYIANNH